MLTSKTKILPPIKGERIRGATFIHRREFLNDISFAHNAEPRLNSSFTTREWISRSDSIALQLPAILWDCSTRTCLRHRFLFSIEAILA